MPAYVVDARSVVLSIRNNLQDRYKTRFSILKELIQNADDAEASRLSVDLWEGMVGAVNPLLAGPGLLVVNDGRYSVKDERGIRHSSASSKTEETGSAGRFGLGQKAVFHLCDAFVVAPAGHGESFAPFVVNPYYGIETTRATTEAWESIEADVARLHAQVDAIAFPGPYLALWLPLRRSDLCPAAGMGFVERRFDDEAARRGLMSELCRPADLATILAATRHLDRIDLRWGGVDVLSLVRSGARLRGVSGGTNGASSEEHIFNGSIALTTDAGSREIRFSGIETLSADADLRAIKADPDWPSTLTLENEKVREKALPHGAGLLVRDASAEPSLLLDWGVFLPIGERPAVAIGIAPSPEPPLSVRLFLHGYFFVDSGRRAILGLGEDGADADEAQGAPVPARWNRALRDRAVLAGLPRLLLSALEDGVLSSGDLARLVRTLAKSPWFATHGLAIEARSVLAEVWDGRRLAWKLLIPTASFRPLPAALLGAPAELRALLPGLDALVGSRELALASADEDGMVRALATEVPAWSAVELAELLDMVPPRAFRQQRQVAAVVEILDGARLGLVAPEAIGAVLRRKLREAIALEASRFPPDEIMRALIRHVPAGTVVFLPDRATHSAVLRALALAPVDTLVVGVQWQGAGGQSRLVNRGHLAGLLRAIEPLAAQEHEAVRAEQATLAAMTLIHASGAALSALAGDEGLRGIRLFPVTQQPEDVRQVLSIRELADAADQRLLFRGTPITYTYLKPLLAALPGLSLSIISNNEKDLFDSVPGLEGRGGNLDPDAVIGLVNAARRFSENAGVRGALVEKIRQSGVQGSTQVVALRRLLAGVAEAGENNAKLYYGVQLGLAPLVERLLRGDAAAYLAADLIADDLSRGELTALALTPFALPEFERRLEEALRRGHFEASEAESLLLLSCGLGASLLRRLPIHELEAGGRVAIDDTMCLAADRPVPAALGPLLHRVRRAPDPAALRVQSDLLPPHDALAELQASLRGLRAGSIAPGALEGAILDALADLPAASMPSDVRDGLRAQAWLTLGGYPVSPGSVLALPEEVGAVAARLLGRGRTLAFHPAASLSPETRAHPGFYKLQSAILPDGRQSFEALALQIAECGLVGLPVVWSEEHLRDLSALARMGIDLALPGWPLAATLLRIGDEDGAASCLSALAPASSAEDLTAVLNALAGAAGPGGTRGEAARRLYAAAFKAGVVPLGEAARQRVFTAAIVPTCDGGWQRASEVAAQAGLAPAWLLDPDLADALRRGPSADGEEPGALPSSMADAVAPASGDLDAISARGFAEFLEPLQGRLPDDLALTLLGLVGRFDAMRAVMARWQGNSGRSIDDHLAEIDRRIDPHIKPHALAREIEGRRLLIEFAADGQARAMSLSGAVFHAPQGEGMSLLVGNGHERGRQLRLPDGRTVVVHTLQLRAHALADASASEVIEHIREFVRILGEGCLGLIRAPQQAAVRDLPEMAGAIAQNLIEQTQADLREELPGLLRQLRLKEHNGLRSLVETYERMTNDRRSLPPLQQASGRIAAEHRLWDGLIDNPAAQAALLGRVRERVAEFGYDPTRVVLELFQNADDATLQLDRSEGPRTFRLRGSPEGFDTVHWGRPINHRGSDRTEGERKNYHRDLQNMLMLHVSDKPGGAETTGKYGLGFKSVHALASEVLVASDLLAARIVGGMLPKAWADGPSEVVGHRREGCPATLIRVPFDTEYGEDGRDALARFGACAPYLPLFAKAIRNVEVEDGVTARAYRARDTRPIDGVAGVQLAVVEGSRPYAALLLDLGAGYTLALKHDETGPTSFQDVPCLWWTAPLDAAVRAGWMLNGPFPLSPNRAALASGADAQAALFAGLGTVLGLRLTALYHAAEEDWPALAAALGLEPTEVPRPKFFARLWDILRSDLDDPVARGLHGPDRGLGVLAAVAPVVPVSEGASSGRGIRGGEAAGVFGGALRDPALRAAVAAWDVLVDRRGRMVTPGTANDLVRLGFSLPPTVTAEGVLWNELEAVDHRVSPAMAARLGAVFTGNALRQAPLQEEGAQLRALATRARFLNRVGAWCSVGDLTVPRPESGSETLRARFAPPERILDETYDSAGREFVLLARAGSGYGPGGETHRAWAELAVTDEAREAVLRFLVTEDVYEDFLASVLRSPPAWMRPLETMVDSPWARSLTPDERNRLRAKLTDYAPSPVSTLAPAAVHTDTLQDRPAAVVLEAIWDWWGREREELIRGYEARAYPADLRPLALPQASSRTELDSRAAWFTFLALACFQGLGGAQAEQHRSFIETAAAQGWWAELSRSPPAADPEVWLARLRDWASDAQPDLAYWRWRRTLIDLYKIARWLPQYAWIAKNLPRAIECAPTRVVSLSDVLAPSFSPVWREAEIEAAPLVRTLGLGANWMVRELARSGFWDARGRSVMAPYGWASTRRVRRLLNDLGAGLGDEGMMDRSRGIWEFVSTRLPHRREDLLRDGDLPLQLITLKAHEDSLLRFRGGSPDADAALMEEDEDEGEDYDLPDAAE